MKKILLIFLIVTASTIFAQDFTIRSLTTRSGITGTDLFITSQSAVDAYWKMSITELLGFVDDQTFTWTGAHVFSGAVSLNGVTTMGASSHFVFAGNGSALYARELTAYDQYLKYTGTVRTDTLVSWNQFYLQPRTLYATSTFAGNVVTNASASSTFNGTVILGNTTITTSTMTFGGAVTFGGSGSLRLGTNTGTLGGSLFRYDLATDLLAYRKDDGGGIDTIPSYAYLRQTYALKNNSIFSGLATFTSCTDLILPNNATGNNQGSIHQKGNEGSGFLVFNYGTSGTSKDTMVSKREFRSGNHDFYGQVDFKSQAVSLVGGLQTIAPTKNFIVISGNASPAVIQNFTGAQEGCRLTILCNPAGSYGFTINDDDVNIQLNGDTNLAMGLGDVVELIQFGSVWFQIAPRSDN